MKKLLSTLLLCVLVLSCIQFARADETQNSKTENLFEALDARGIPQDLHGKDLTAAWRMMRAPANWSVIESAMLLRRNSYEDTSAIELNPLFYTRGDVISVGSESYLIAYAIDFSADPEERERRQYLNPSRRQYSQSQGEMNPDFSEFKIAENDVLRLVLLDLRTTGNLAFAPFDPAKNRITETDQREMRVLEDRAQSQSNMKQLMLGLLEYTQDYDEKLPPMRAAKSAEDLTGNWSDKNLPVFILLYPYLKSTQICVQPATGRPYVPNWRISRKSLASIPNTSQAIAFYEDAPDAEGFRNVAFADGHIKAFPEKQWQEMRAEAKIPP